MPEMQYPAQVPGAYRGAVHGSPRGVTGGLTVAETDQDQVVVFMVGMRINRLRRLRSWLPVFVAMPRMLVQLAKNPDLGLLGTRTFWSGRVIMVMQYWRSAEELGAFARDPDLAHQPAWARFNKAAAGSGDVGIFHETYVVSASDIETVYGNMPPFGLAAAHRAVPRQRGRRTHTQDRLGQRRVEAQPAESA